MGSADLDGNAAFHNRHTGGEINTGFRIITDDLGKAHVYVGAGDDIDEIEFTGRRAQYHLSEVVLAFERREFRRRPIRPVPKPASAPCEVCGGERYYHDAFSGEVYRCPVCG